MEDKIDLAYLLQLMEGDEAMVSRFLELFKAEMPKQLAELEEQLKLGDFASANITVHCIKGQLSTVGLKELAGHALEIEYKTEQDFDRAEVTRHFTALKSRIEALY